MSDTVTVRPFRFKSGSGKGIKGIWFEPLSARQREVGYIYLPGIVLGASAVHRLGVDLGNRLAAAGHPFCLFDHAGVGESEGEYPEGTHQQLASWVEKGNLVEDTVHALAEFQRLARVASIALIGHCGGALTSLYTLARDPLACAALLLSPPTVIMGKRDEHARPMAVDHGFNLYLQKLASLEAWRRLLGGRSDYKLLMPIVRRKMMQLARSLSARVGARRSTPAGDATAQPDSREPDFNPLFENALVAAQSNGKLVRVAFGDRDPDVDDFRAFVQRHPTLQHGILSQTSHGFLTEASQALLWAEVDSFTAMVGARASVSKGVA